MSAPIASTFHPTMPHAAALPHNVQLPNATPNDTLPLAEMDTL